MLRTLVKPALLSAAVLAASIGALALPTAAQAQTYLSVQIGPPPPPRYEAMPMARPGYVWAPGHYEWRHDNYVWRRGYWMAARPGYAYVAPMWVAEGPRWVYRPQRWERRPVHAGPPHWREREWRDRDRDRGRGHDRARHRRDRDRDGVPDRYDRRPNNPYRH
ncbi:MAG TPA: YXWGXW repeat-containing protein [Ottowia sp.]|nr:YXWGXW repeat-containing protein [Ottowia sp.]